MLPTTIGVRPRQPSCSRAQDSPELKQDASTTYQPLCWTPVGVSDAHEPPPLQRRVLSLRYLWRDSSRLSSVSASMQNMPTGRAPLLTHTPCAHTRSTAFTQPSRSGLFV